MLKTIGDVILWLLGLICLLSAFVFAYKAEVTLLVPLGYLLLAILLIPYTWDKLTTLANRKIHVAWRIVVIFVIYMATGIIMSKDLGITYDYGSESVFEDANRKIKDSLNNNQIPPPSE